MTSLVKYGSFDLDALEKADEKIGAKTGGADFMKMLPGRSRVRFLPPQAGEASPFAVVQEHFLTAKNGQKVSFACPRKSSNPPSPCPACDEGRRLKSASNPLDREKADSYWPGLRIYANVIDRDKPAAPRILGFGKQVWEGLKRIRKDVEEGGDFTNPTSAGFDITITREGIGKFDTNYSVAAARSSSPLAESPEAVEEYLGAQWDLERYTNVPTLDEVLVMMTQGYEKEETTNTSSLLLESSTGRGNKKKKDTSLQDGVYDVDADDVPY